MKVRIKRWHGVATWRWGVEDEECCGICRYAFEACCPDCAMPGDGCPPVWGACNHAFHMHCLMKWLESLQSMRQHCPMCRQDWKFRN
ncbi:Anaphase-promoting complex subunit 11 [Phytophthora cinnamomi]|uniref:Anaphase-promoting complex subunit 11 n=1 Tax=Phytophthora cinnamomi TaxID=4785 RepID=UPI003559CBE0|nr:Anaphase-promoting complex subunit 11 [Phytophthora cinnamomi]